VRKAVKVLIILNLINYLNNFIFAYVHANDELYKIVKSNFHILGVWVFSPYLIIMLTSFILATDYKEGYKIFRKEAMVDWIIRVVSCCVVFQEFNFKFLSLEYILQQSILGLLLIVNIFLEYRMYQKSKNYITVEKDIEEIPEEEIENVRQVGKAITFGVFSFFIFISGALSVASTSHVAETQISRVIPIIVSICVFVWYEFYSYRKYSLFYLDKAKGRKKFIIDNAFASIGFLISFLSALEIFGSKDWIYSLSTFIAVFFLYPTIYTNREMGLRYLKISKVLGDDIYKYYVNKSK
jgi:hypothetical protein